MHGRLVRKAAHGDPLGGTLGGVGRIDLDVVAEGMGFVTKIIGCGRARGCNIPARKAQVTGIGRRMPALSEQAARRARRRGRGNAIAGTRRKQLGVGGHGGTRRHVEVEGPVLLAGQHRSPGGPARAAIVERAARGGAGGIEFRCQLRADRSQMCCGPAHIDHRVWIDAAIEWRIQPVARDGAVGLDGELDQRDAVVVDLLVHFGGRACIAVPGAELAELHAGLGTRGLAVRMEEVRIGRALVIHGEHRARLRRRADLATRIDVEKLHAVVMVAYTPRPVIGFQAGIAVGCNRAVQTIAGCMNDACRIARGQHDCSLRQSRPGSR